MASAMGKKGTHAPGNVPDMLLFFRLSMVTEPKELQELGSVPAQACQGKWTHQAALLNFSNPGSALLPKTCQPHCYMLLQ